jgi:hypothetical protein
MWRRSAISVLCVALIVLTMVAPLSAGMPAPLPTGWTAGETPSWATSGQSPGADARWQALSFFVACLLGLSWFVKRLWNALRRDLPALPRLGYGRALSFVLLWGLLFVIVLTMISGARELMTPGAWQKRGWTYQLASTASATPPADNKAERRQALEQLRWALWQYAAAHHGQFPAQEDQGIDPGLWEVPGWPGLEFLYVSGLTAAGQGQLLAFEPEVDGDSRWALLSNGMIGEMRTAEIQFALAEAESP